MSSEKLSSFINEGENSAAPSLDTVKLKHSAAAAGTETDCSLTIILTVSSSQAGRDVTVGPNTTHTSTLLVFVFDSSSFLFSVIEKLTFRTFFTFMSLPVINRFGDNLRKKLW